MDRIAIVHEVGYAVDDVIPMSFIERGTALWDVDGASERYAAELTDWGSLANRTGAVEVWISNNVDSRS